MQKTNGAKESGESGKKKLVLRRESIKALDSLNLEFEAGSMTLNSCAPSSNKPT